MTQAPSSGPRPSDRWIPWYLVAFFVALISALVPMCLVAVRTNPGVVTENAYEKGLAYNAIIAAAEKQKALGWHGDLIVHPEASADQIQVEFVLMDTENRPIKDAEVRCVLVRPMDGTMDKNVAMLAVAEGHYAAAIPVTARGLWEARISVLRGDDHYQMSKRIVVP